MYFCFPILEKNRELEPAYQTIGKKSIPYDQRTAVSDTTNALYEPRHDERGIRELSV